ncbi:hypothetical protein DFJ73DRAFT_623256 [Zopfochytrium polystomum]|nr:hypothetical protein DFJ73DRAFT_623256 [Zopfochytrium polystomum]
MRHSSDGFVHRSITCNHCNLSPVRGFRFKCVNCVDFDLCETCEAAEVHTKTHVFIKIRIPIPPHANPRSTLIPLFYPGTGFSSDQAPSVDFKELQKNTHFDMVELEGFYEQYKSLATVEHTDTSEGGITREVFEKCLGPLGMEKNLITDRIFAFFDQDQDSLISFKELVCGMSILCKGSLDERITYAFQGYDLDGDGKISREELHRMFKAYFYLSMELVRDFVKTMEEGMMETFDDEASKPVSASFSAPIVGSGIEPIDEEEKEDQSHEDAASILLSNASGAMSNLHHGASAPQASDLALSSVSTNTGLVGNDGQPSSPVVAVSGTGVEDLAFEAGMMDIEEVQWPIIEAMSQDAIEEMVEKTFIAAGAANPKFITLSEFRKAVESDNSYLQWFEALGSVF